MHAFLIDFMISSLMCFVAAVCSPRVVKFDVGRHCSRHSTSSTLRPGAVNNGFSSQVYSMPIPTEIEVHQETETKRKKKTNNTKYVHQTCWTGHIYHLLLASTSVFLLFPNINFHSSAHPQNQIIYQHIIVHSTMHIQNDYGAFKSIVHIGLAVRVVTADIDSNVFGLTNLFWKIYLPSITGRSVSEWGRRPRRWWPPPLCSIGEPKGINLRWLRHIILIQSKSRPLLVQLVYAINI